MNASIITATTAPVRAESHAVPAGVPATRRAGALVGAGVSGAAAAIATLFGAPYLALGIPAATVAGFWLGPRVRSTGDLGSVAIAMGSLTVVVAETMLFLGSGVAALAAADPFDGTSLVSAIAGGLLLFMIGLIVVGIPMLIVTVPCGLVWAALVRRMAAWQAGS